MQQRLIELHQQRGRLQERIATQRSTLAQQLAPLDRALDFGTRISTMAQGTKAFVIRHPVLVTAVVATVVVLKPASVLRWSRRALLTWRTWRVVRPLLPDFLLNRLFGRSRPVP